MTASSFIVVAGPPASGKSTVARQLAGHLGIALIAKDDFKERLFYAGSGTAGGDRRDLGIRAFAAALQGAARYLRRGESVLLEGNWRAADHGAEIAALVRDRRPRVLQIQCVAEGELLLERFIARAHSGSRHAVHADLEALPRLRGELLRGRYDPLPLDGPLLTIDTTSPADHDGAAWIAAAVALLQR